MALASKYESFLCKHHHCGLQGAEDSVKIQHNRVKSPVELEKSEISVLGQVLSLGIDLHAFFLESVLRGQYTRMSNIEVLKS